MRCLLVIAVAVAGCSSEPDVPEDVPPTEEVDSKPTGPGPDTGIWLRDVTDLIAPGELNTRGAAMFDVDQDGHVDVLLAGTSGLHMWRNRGDGTFEAYTEEAGLSFPDGHSSIGLSLGDVEGDGDLDIFVSRIQAPDVLLIAEADEGGVFYENGTAAAGISGVTYSQGASFGDLDGDGDLDIYVSVVGRAIDGPKPTPGLGGDDNIYWRNDGEGGFVNATEEAGLAGRAYGESFQSVLFDVDGDHDLDVFVVHDFESDQLFLNDGQGHFTDGGQDWIPHVGSGLMGIDVGDLDADGHLDIYATNWGTDHLYLYDPSRPGFDERMEQALGDGFDSSGVLTGWGCAIADFDNDGDQDVITTAAFSDGTGYEPVPVTREGAMTVYENRGKDGDPGLLVDITEDAGDAFDIPLNGFGLAVGDIDDDGDLDVIVGVDKEIDTEILSPGVRRTPLLLRNESPKTASNHGLTIRLSQPGTKNPFAVGARVDIAVGDIRQSRVLLAGSSFMSCNDFGLHFGLGTNATADVTVTWPDGHQTEEKAVPAGSTTIVRDSPTP